jgi:predicted secreted protein
MATVEDRTKLVDRESGNSMATFSLVAVIVVVGLIALFVWQPWNITTRTNSTTTITQPGAAAPAQRNTTTTTTTTTGKGQ